VDSDRHLNWQGSYNMRDLGGLPTRSGPPIVWGSVVRGDAPDHLTDRGWSALSGYGIKTIIDLRHAHERDTAARSRPPGTTTVHVPLDDPNDTEFWQHWSGGLDCTPLYYRAFLDRFPQRIARVIATLADAPAGGVLIHCAGGRDRTGLIVLLLLALTDVPTETIATDYTLSAQRLEPAWLALDLGDQNGKIEALLARHGTTAHQAIVTTLGSLDAVEYLHGTGLTNAQLQAVRARLLGAKGQPLTTPQQLSQRRL
jgi:protein-tyrosine phosphatase